MKILFLNSKTETIGVLLDVDSIVKMIRDGYVKEKVEAARKILKEDENRKYRNIKSQLPCICWALSDYNRNGEQLSGFMYVDFDGKDNPGMNVEEAKKKLAEKFKNLCFAFASVSGEGLGAVFVFDGITIENYSVIHKNLRKTIYNQTQLTPDSAASDFKRLNFLSYDRNIYVNPTPQRISAHIYVSLDTGGETRIKGDALERARQIRMWAEFCRKESIRIANTYEEWLAILAAIVNTIGEKGICKELAHLISETHPEKNIPHETEKKIEDLFRKPLLSYQWGTIFYFSKRTGFRMNFENQEGPSLWDFFSAPLPEKVNICFREIWGGNVLYNVTKKIFMVYQTGVWEDDPLFDPTYEVIWAIAKKVNEAQKCIARMDLPRSQQQEERKKRGVHTVEKILQSPNALQSFIKIAHKVPQLRITQDRFDQHPNLIAFNNGVLDLETGELHQHKTSFFLTKKLNFDYDKKATTHSFLDFILDIFDYDERKVLFLKRFVGVCLSGRTDLFQGITFFWGSGANGKTTLVNILRLLLGRFCVTIPNRIIINRSEYGISDYIKAMLLGARLAVIPEIPENIYINDANLKELTGGDRIVARNPYEKFFEFTPTHKMLMVGNHKPKISYNDEAIWRRFFFLEFNKVIPPEKRKPESEILAEMKKDLPGIFNFFLEGYWQAVKMGGIPKDELMLQQLEGYRWENHPLRVFLETYYIPDPSGEVLFAEVYHNYIQFCEANNIIRDSIYSKIKFSKLLKEISYGGVTITTDKRYKDGAAVFRGIKKKD